MPVLALPLLTLLGADPATAQLPPDERAAWLLGLEASRAPGLMLGWETTREGWSVGARSGAAPGRGDLRLRLTPALRLDRILPWGLRAGTSLGLEWTWRTDAGNADESEIQWEVGAGWAPSPRVLVELGARRTDYRRHRWEGVARLALRPGASGQIGSLDPPLIGATPASGPPPGVPDEGAVGGRLAAGMPVRPDAVGTHLLLQAANPRGDPDPWDGRGDGNVDRLGLRAEANVQAGPATGWLRWRSDLHSDPSIAPRLREIAGDLGFPVTVSFAGGAEWADPDGAARASIVLRHAPQAFLWMPHLGEERTAQVRALRVEGRLHAFDGRVSHGALARVAGRAVEPLSHGTFRVRHSGLGVSGVGPLAVGFEHGWLELEAEEAGIGSRTRGRGERRTRLFAERDGRMFARAAAGSDVVIRIGVASEHRPAEDPHAPDPAWRGGPERSAGPEGNQANDEPARWRGAVSLGLTSRPDLLHLETLVGRGWGTEAGAAGASSAPELARSVVRVDADLGHGGWTLHGTSLWGEPLAVDGVYRHVRGGWLDLVWAEAVRRASVRLRLRAAEWGPPALWWREEATVAGDAFFVLLERPARLDATLRGRSDLTSARNGLREPGGFELGVVLALPFPLPAATAATAAARLDDLLDRRLAARVGAPRPGRRLTLTVAVIP